MRARQALFPTELRPPNLCTLGLRRPKVGSEAGCLCNLLCYHRIFFAHKRACHPRFRPFASLCAWLSPRYSSRLRQKSRSVKTKNPSVLSDALGSLTKTFRFPGGGYMPPLPASAILPKLSCRSSPHASAGFACPSADMIRACAGWAAAGMPHRRCAGIIRVSDRCNFMFFLSCVKNGLPETKTA